MTIFVAYFYLYANDVDAFDETTLSHHRDAAATASVGFYKWDPPHVM